MQMSNSLDTAMPDFKPLRRSILISAVLPAIAITVLTRYGMPTLQAILASTVFPLAEIATYWRRSRRLDAIAVVSLAALAISFATSWWGGDPRFALVKDSTLTLIFGSLFLASLLAPRPLIFYVSQQYMEGATAQAWEERWASSATFRTTMRVMTAVWGIGLLGDAVARIILALTVAPITTAVVSPIIAIAVFGGLILWTLAYIRRARAQRTA